MLFKKLTLKDKELFDKFLQRQGHRLSVYAFENIYIWRGFFDIRWLIIKDNLCIFFQDNIGCFLYLPPLGKKINPAVIEEVFKIMDKFNTNKDVSRIENAEERQVPIFKSLGYACDYKSRDYLYKRNDLVELKGNRFKSKRSAFNYFTKHYQSEYLPFSLKYRQACLQLYNLWKDERKSKVKDTLYQAMLEDSQICLKILLEDYSHLDLRGRLVKVGRQVKAFTFGFPLNSKAFCVLYEIADLSLRGITQFIFRSFCSELNEYKYINIMDDSGLDNLKAVKLSYHPVRFAPSYIIKRKDGPRPS